MRKKKETGAVFIQYITITIGFGKREMNQLSFGNKQMLQLN